ncbi:hypothetical protein [Haloferula rosea]|uniref:Uncharacterized protein n=1 Tax=Haloferula rosea TaxID=490093 RepID=A0A934RGB2_9BACT|nr:hypothetical protein [Haloferula rosea]MBK1829033.1 hypothetical protein [Haloferula rosea]
MTAAVPIAILLSSAAISVGTEVGPEKPEPAVIARICGIDEARVSADDKERPTLNTRVIWMATYRITGEQDCGLAITLFPNDRIKTDFIEKIGANQTEFQKITRDNGDVIYHSLGDRGDQGTYYMTTLINHEEDWDMSLMLSREPGVDESKLPFAIAKDGIKLIGEIEAVLRKPKAQQGVAPQSATRSESESEGSGKPQPESEERSR